MPSKFGGIAVEESKSRFGGIPVSDPEMNPGHAPTLGDQAMDSLKFAGNEALGAGKAVIAPITALANRVTHPPDYTNTPMVNPTEVGQAPIVKMASDINNQMNTGDMSGLAQNLGGIGAQIAMGKGLPETPAAVRSLGDMASTPLGAGVKAAGMAYLKEQPKNIPVVGKPLMAAYEAYKSASDSAKSATTTASPELLDGVSQMILKKTFDKATPAEKLYVQRFAEKIQPSK